jgi:glycosyl hydrolase family 2
MPYPHVIRLRGPWEFEVVENASALTSPRSGKAKLPCDWSEALGREFRGQVRYRRRFNRPSGLDPHERVWLIVEGVDAFGAATLNGRELGEVRGYALPASFDVTDLLAQGNELLLDVELPRGLPDGPAPLRPGREDLAAGPIGEVRLEIRAAASIERLAIWAAHEGGAARLHVGGQIVGADGGAPLAVVVNGGQRELLYGDVERGEPFLFSTLVEGFPIWPYPTGVDAGWSLEIKLLGGGGALWQAELQTAAFDARRQTKTPQAPEPIVLRQILPEAMYARSDQSGQAVVQAVPLSWAEQVCPRLAHHPSIAAWTASGAELAEAGEERLQRLAYGRRWLASERCLG